jgi:hypothetical protein
MISVVSSTFGAFLFFVLRRVAGSQIPSNHYQYKLGYVYKTKKCIESTLVYKFSFASVLANSHASYESVQVMLYDSSGSTHLKFIAVNARTG